MSVVSGDLKAKRAELVDEADRLAAQAAELREQVADVDRVIRIHEPDYQ
jgi:hypothetical protein